MILFSVSQTLHTGTSSMYHGILGFSIALCQILVWMIEAEGNMVKTEKVKVTDTGSR